MFFKKIFSIFLVLAISVIPVFADGEVEKQGKKYDFTFSLAGGNMGGKFTLTGDFLYARQFGGIFFVQAAGFADISGDGKEYGASIGIGAYDVGIGADAKNRPLVLYLFGDSLYSYQNWWFQLRPVIRLRTEYLGLEAFYAFPIKVASVFNLQNPKLQDSIVVDGKEICAVNYWGGEAEIVPVDWVRIYGSAMLVQKTYKRFSVGAEVRLWRYFSLSANWHKQDSGIYSNWGNYDDFSIALNVLFGAEQSSFSPAHKLAVTPRYPILAEKKKEPEPEPTWATFEVRYRRVHEVTHPKLRDDVTACLDHAKYGGINLRSFVKTGENEWQAEITLDFSDIEYYIWISDIKIWGLSIAREISMRLKGSKEWIVLTCIEKNPWDKSGGEWAKFRATKRGPQNPC